MYMALLSEVKYETNIKDLNGISPDSVLSMLMDVRADIRRVDGSFADVDLTRVLKIVQAGEYTVKGEYTVNGSISIHINLLSAKGVIDSYKRYSEGGCDSCVNLGRETINAQDGTTGWYCQVSDPDYVTNVVTKRSEVRYSGFSPKVRMYHDKPCDDWKPKFSPKLEELIGKKQ